MYVSSLWTNVYNFVLFPFLSLSLSRSSDCHRCYYFFVSFLLSILLALDRHRKRRKKIGNPLPTLRHHHSITLSLSQLFCFLLELEQRSMHTHVLLYCTIVCVCVSIHHLFLSFLWALCAVISGTFQLDGLSFPKQSIQMNRIRNKKKKKKKKKKKNESLSSLFRPNTNSMWYYSSFVMVVLVVSSTLAELRRWEGDICIISTLRPF